MIQQKIENKNNKTKQKNNYFIIATDFNKNEIVSDVFYGNKEIDTIKKFLYDNFNIRIDIFRIY